MKTMILTTENGTYRKEVSTVRARYLVVAHYASGGEPLITAHMERSAAQYVAKAFATSGGCSLVETGEGVLEGTE